jgi:hypothetical protein
LYRCHILPTAHGARAYRGHTVDAGLVSFTACCARCASHGSRSGRRLDCRRDAARRSSVNGHVSFGPSVVSACFAATYVPDGEEEEPSPDADDDYEEPAPKETRAQQTRAAAESAEHDRAADAAVANGAPAQRPSRAAATAANAAMDALEVCGELV